MECVLVTHRQGYSCTPSLDVVPVPRQLRRAREVHRRIAVRLRERRSAKDVSRPLKNGCATWTSCSRSRNSRREVFRVSRGDGSDKKEARLEKQATWLRENLITLGPTFIKIGQALGTRGDLLPLAYIKELTTLQDQVPAFSTAEAFARIEADLGHPLHEAYAEIDAEPIAAASLGQVYRAKLHGGQEVAVKVQRPNLHETISFDIAVLCKLVTLTTGFFPRANENAMGRYAARVSRHHLEEMDYAKEGRNADRFRQSFREWRVIRVPKIYWSHTTSRVLTMDFIRGTKVTDLRLCARERYHRLKLIVCWFALI